MGEMRNAVLEKPMGGDHSEDLGEDGRIIFE
jgi:hypothetical protein